MPLFVVIALSLIAALHLLIYRRVARAPQWPRRTRISVGVALVVLGALFVGAWSSAWAPLLSPAAARPFAWVGMIWLAFGFYLLLGLLPVAIVAGVVALRGGPGANGRRIRVNRAGAVMALVVATATTTWGIAEAAEPQITTWQVSSTELPAEFDGTTVVLLSDLHIGAVNSDRLAEDVVAAVNAVEPDLVILAGDVVEGSPDRYGYQLEPLADLDADLGVYAVTGNHEFISGEPAAWTELWEDLGIVVLQNESVTVERAGAAITIAGVHDALGDGEMTSDPLEALAGVDRDQFILYVAHQPAQAEDAQGLGIDLQVSGHTHGGQLWPMHYAVLANQPMLDGRALVGDVDVITSRGAAAWGPPVRVGAPPEIPVITLTAG